MSRLIVLAMVSTVALGKRALSQIRSQTAVPARND